MIENPTIKVIPKENYYEVSSELSILDHCENITDAIDFARGLAIKHSGYLHVYRGDGSLRSVDDYSEPPTGYIPRDICLRVLTDGFSKDELIGS